MLASSEARYVNQAIGDQLLVHHRTLYLWPVSQVRRANIPLQSFPLGLIALLFHSVKKLRAPNPVAARLLEEASAARPVHQSVMHVPESLVFL